jgi:hypothetical protein
MVMQVLQETQILKERQAWKRYQFLIDFIIAAVEK